jgi:hypothetical protein
MNIQSFFSEHTEVAAPAARELPAIAFSADMAIRHAVVEALDALLHAWARS